MRNILLLISAILICIGVYLIFEDKPIQQGVKYFKEHKYKEAFKIFEKYKDDKDIRISAVARYYLSTMYSEGLGVRQDLNEAFYITKKSAEMGDKHAQISTGEAYLKGNGTYVDYVKAIYWLKKSSEQDSEDAQFLLALMYYEGEGIDINYELALDYAKKAASKGHIVAEILIADAYTTGRGVNINLGEAYRILFKIRNAGDFTKNAFNDFCNTYVEICKK